MKRAFITGITGQDGSYLAELLLEKGYVVHGIIRRSSTFNTERIDHIYDDRHDDDARLFLHYGDLTDASSIQDALAKAEPETFSLLIFYRGLHCPICKTYLQKFDAMFDDFAKLGVEFSALSMDPRERAEQAMKEWGIDNLPIGYGIAEATARRWGLYISESIKDGEPRRFNEPGLFLVRPDGELHYVAINSMPFGRPEPDAMLKAISFILDEEYPARGRLAA